MRVRCIIALGLAVAWLPASARADEWPQFRGPGGSGVAADKQLPQEWGTDKNVQWKTKIPGRGWSSPIVWGDKVFLTAAFSDKEPVARAGGGGGPGGFGGGPGGFGGGFGGPGQPGQIVPSFLQDRLNLSADQKKQLEELQKDVDAKLAKLLTEEQNKRLKDLGAGGGRGGFGGGGFPGGAGPGGFGGGGFGRGAAPPDRVYRFEVYCLDRNSGNVLWKQVALQGKPRIATHGSNTYASETPVTDGERVYAYFGMHGLFCYDLAGKLLWKKDLGSFPMQMGWGTASSPVLDDERLFLQIDNEEKSFVVALDKKTGEEKWRQSRSERSNWGSPIVWKNKMRSELVTAGSQKVRSYDPATGKVLWELTPGGGSCNATPVADDEQLYVGTGGRGGFGGEFAGGAGGGGRPGGGGGRGGMGGGGGGLFAVKAGASDDVTPKQGESTSNGVAWSQKSGPAMASPLVYQGYVYILEQNGGMVTCYDAKTGKAAYTKERILGARAFWASPWANDGKVFCLDDGGTTWILQAGPTFKVLGKNTLSDQCWATPAVAGGSLIVRGVDNIYCIKQ